MVIRNQRAGAPHADTPRAIPTDAPEAVMTHTKQFSNEIRERIHDTRRSLVEARHCGDDYLVDVRLGELESLARVAAEHGITVEGVEESLAAHGLATPALGLPLVMDRHREPVAASA